MIVGVCGYGYTGSGAVLDFLKEFRDNKVIDDMEFTLTYLPGGLEDLEYFLTKNHSRFFSGDRAIKRFKRFIKSLNSPKHPYNKLTKNKFYDISSKYIDSLIQVRWKGCWACDLIEASWWKKNFEYRLMKYRVLKLINRTSIKGFYFPPYNRDVYLSINPDNFYELTKNYIRELLGAMCGPQYSEYNIVLDQPFSADNPEKSFVFFENPVAIIVDRDPRDLFILAKEVVPLQASFIPTDNVYNFVKYYKIIRENRKKIIDPEKALYLNFEDMIYEYKTTKEKIIDFLGLKFHNKPLEYFNPEVSKYNTQLFNKYTKYKKEIEYIEKELEEWLYPFYKYPPITDFKKSF